MRRLSLYDSRTRETRVFQPIAPPRVGLYVCGLTPYAPAHVGHGRTFAFFDVVARALRRWGYRVFYVQNVTNLDDHLIARASEEGVDPLQLAERHFAEYRQSMDALGIRSVDYYPFATDYVPEIIAQIRSLVDRGYAYAADDGSVYFSVAKFADYGKLSGQRLESLKPGARLEIDPRKRAPEDFVIWKATTPGEPSWESPWGPGRPGWHVEDTAMILRLLGERCDLHGAGVDLIFPHHEAEVALAEATTGAVPFANYWMHSGLLLMEDEKMSKSLGNVASLDEAIRSVGPGPLRLFYLNAHYRSPLVYQAGKSLEEAREAYSRLTVVSERIAEILERDGVDRPGAEIPDPLATEAEKLVEQLDNVLAEDFNTREAIALLFGWTRRLAEELPRLEGYSGSALEELAGPFRWGEEVLGLFARAPSGPAGAWAALVPVAMAARARARARGDYAEADRIRDELRAVGVELEDDSVGTRWRATRNRS
ncbi:MAG TPA: cysteine--tRNA ligase [Thermoplasmata archaeon]|nr:cysteine--tRNA ligase [Thermoplasmata archaeon]